MKARVAAPLVAAVLGVCGGVTAALVTPADDVARDPAISDPLQLGIPLRNLDCTGASLLVLGYGDNRASLSTAVVNNDENGLSYLSSEDSCATIIGPEDKPTPAYAVYRGPYPRRHACELRMSGEKGGGFVTVLHEGNTELVKCPCELPATDAPRLFLGMPPDPHNRLWIRSLQAMFHDDDAEGFPHDAITGVYDQPTADRVIEFQDDAPGQQTVRGVVDATTWGILTERLCRQYTY